MTDRLRTLLHDEARTLAIPQPSVATAIAGGRRRVRRRRAILATGVAATVIAAGLLTQVATRPDAAVVLDPASAPAATEWAVAQGSTVHLGTGRTLTVPGQVKALYYTSAGMLVRVGATPYTDAPDSNYWLAHPDGRLTDFKLSLGDRVPGTDPTLPYLAYATKGSDARHWTVVIRDVRSGATVREIPIQGAFTWAGWVAPPVSLAGDHVYVGVDDKLLDVAWRTGKVRTTTIDTHMPDTHATHDVTSDGGYVVVHDVTTGAIIYRTRPGSDTVGQLSPDGTHLLVLPYAMCTDDGSCGYGHKPARLLDLATGHTVTTRLSYGAFGWSATGELLIVDGTTVKSCDPDTLQCSTTKVALDGDGPIRVSGNSNES